MQVIESSVNGMFSNLVRKKRLLAGLALVLVASLCPRRNTLAPDCDVTVSDNKGQGIPSVMVRRYTQDYSSGRALDLSAESTTDFRGHAHFPRVTHWNSLAGEIFGCGKQVALTGAHASCGTYIDITVSSDNLIETARTEKSGHDGAKELRLTMATCPSGDYWACYAAIHRS